MSAAVPVIYVLACVAVGVVGVVVGRHPPGSPMGRPLLFFTVLLMLSLGGGYYAVFCYLLAGLLGWSQQVPQRHWT
jgi:uncharacterized membrane protein